MGIFNLWVNYFKGKKIVYINYLPLWNFLIFMLVPPKTIFGPITGSSYNNSANNMLNKFIRQFIFPIFFNISVMFLLIRKSKNTFSTSLLKNKTTKKIRLNSLYDIQLILKNKTYLNRKKNYDLVIYNRKHDSKNEFNFEDILNLIKHKRYKILVIGEKINVKNIKNLGFLPHDKVIKYLSKTKFTIIPSDNINSFYFLDAYFCKVKTLMSKKIYYEWYTFHENRWYTFH